MLLFVQQNILQQFEIQYQLWKYKQYITPLFQQFLSSASILYIFLYLMKPSSFNIYLANTELNATFLSFCLAVISCDFESLCLWTLSNHSDQSDWSVVSPQQPQSAQAGMVPVTDHSVGSSDGKRLTESLTKWEWTLVYCS